MKASTKLALTIAAVALALPNAALAKSAALSTQWAGTWHLNIDKSKFASSDMRPKAEVRTYTVSGNRLTMKSNMTNETGKTIKWTYSAPTDGKWYPAAGNPNLDRISLTLVSDREVKAKTTNRGKPGGSATLSVSEDGKELTVNRSIPGAKGGRVDDTLVYDRAN